MNDDPNKSLTDAELESRITAMVMGEVSASERERLEQLIGQRPELATLHHELQSVDRWLADVARSGADDLEQDWKLSPSRRAAVLSVIEDEPLSSGPAVTLPAVRSVDSQAALVADTGKPENWYPTVAILVTVACVGLLLIVLVLPAQHAAREAASVRGGQPTTDSSRMWGGFEPKSRIVDSEELAVDSTTDFADHSGERYRFDQTAKRKLESATANADHAIGDLRDKLAIGSGTVREYDFDDDVRYLQATPEFAGSPPAAGTLSAPALAAVEPLATEGTNGLESAGRGITFERSKSLSGPGEREPKNYARSSRTRQAGQGQAGAGSANPATQGLQSFSTQLEFPRGGSVQDRAADSGAEENGQYGLGQHEVDAELPRHHRASAAEANRRYGLPMSGGMGGGVATDGAADASVAAINGALDKAIETPRDTKLDALDRNANVNIARGENLWEEQAGKEAKRIDEVLQFGEVGDVTGAAVARTSPKGRDLSVSNQIADLGASDQPQRMSKDNLSLYSIGDGKSDPIPGQDQQQWFKNGVWADDADGEFSDYEAILEAKQKLGESLRETLASREPFSTFSLHVSDVSFKLAQAALARGEWPQADSVRIEEFVNAFDYGDPLPSQHERVACQIEQSIHPFLQQRNLLRIGIRTSAIGRSSETPLRLTLLLDNSGSMERIDRRETVRRAFALLAGQLTPIDQVTLIGFARQPRLLADKVSGGDVDSLVQLVDGLPSEGGTNLEAALQLAFEKASEQQSEQAQNRIILLTDGAVNLGDANPDRLSQMVEMMRESGIAFDAAGISAEGLNDEVLEALTRRGDGRYYLLDFPAAADDGFVRQIAGALRPSAKNVKVQVQFNPQRVGRYKLLGFEKHRLNTEDFRDDTVDAAELAAAESGVALYQFQPLPDGQGDVGSVSVRFRDLSSGQMVEQRWPIPYQPEAPHADQSSASMRVAMSAAMLAAKFQAGPLAESVDLGTLAELTAGLPQQELRSSRVEQLREMIQRARDLSNNP